MKREIKFRCWFPAGTDTGDGEIEKGEMCYHLAFEDYEPINDLLNGVEHLMQYTGLKDSKGVEIYEGDILRRDYQRYGGLEVRWSDGSFRFFEKGEAIATCVCANNIKELKVIGNLFQNPELLEVK